MNVKLDDVARRAGLSKATVSMALNGSEKISARTRARVEALAREMGYRPNLYARRLVTQRSRQLGLIVPDLENVYYASLVRHAFEALRASGYGLFVSTSMNSRLTERGVLMEMLESRVEGLLLAPVNTPNEKPGYLEALDEAGVPLLFVTSLYEGVDRPCVMCDLYGGMQGLLEALFAKGYRRMTLLSGPPDVYCLDLRERGYRDFMRAHGLEARVAHLADVGYEAARTYVFERGTDGAEALVCVNDMMALGAVNALRERGVPVPQEAAVTGFDDVIFSRVSPVPITTVRQDLRRLAAGAVERILDMVDGAARREIPAQTLLPCEIVLRDSVWERKEE